jgi:DNA uptake protein ComE-like DNA-binding protein
MKIALVSAICLLALAGCSRSDRSPEAIRQDTAKVTTEATKDVKAVAKGVEDALQNKSTAATSVNINSASAADLERLPGIGAVSARRIVARRPFRDTSDLVKRRVVSQAEYDRISSQISAQ